MVTRTLMEVLLFIAQMGTVMDQTKSGSRIVVIGSNASANETTAYLQPSKQRPTTHRLVVFRNGELVGIRPGR
jgi:hypothetical protein